MVVGVASAIPDIVSKIEKLKWKVDKKMVRDCVTRARKYAARIAAAAGLTSEEQENLRAAYERDCKHWESGWKEGMKAYAATGRTR